MALTWANNLLSEFFIYICLSQIYHCKINLMDWRGQQAEKFKDVGSLLITIILDSFLVIVVGILSNFVTVFLESYVLHKSIETANLAIYYTYIISKILIIAIVAIFVIVDICKATIKAIKQIKQEYESE